METVSIRDLRGESLRQYAGKGKVVAITYRGGLIAVAIPVSPAWLEHVIDYNVSYIQQSIDESEKAIATWAPMVTLNDVIGKLHAALSQPDNKTAQDPSPSPVPTHTVRIGDLSAKVIADAGDAGRTLAITHDRELVAILIPVTRNLVEFLLEQNMSRVLDGIHQAEKQMSTDEPMVSLDSIAKPAEAIS